MKEPISITSNDPRLADLKFTSFRNTVERRCEEFQPGAHEPQSQEIKTPWGAELTARAGDYIVSDINKPEDRWPVERKIFQETYIISRPGYCMKNAVTELVPMIELTGGDPNQLVTVHSLEGAETVRAGGFYLARGVRGEIWAYPKNRMTGTLTMPRPK
jgi:hypothetical protein